VRSSEAVSAYTVCFEVAGPLAIFTRPDTGATPTSYPVPTWSAAKGLFESIAFFADGAAWICPTRTEVCRRVGETGGQVRFQRYTTNYGGPERKANLFT
jgi:CRISPR-associated protein Cas5d